MASWFQGPAYLALEGALRQLMHPAGAGGVAVVDESDFLWCYACYARSDEFVEFIKEFYLAEVGPCRARLKRGQKLEVCRAWQPEAGVDGYWAQSFASIYVLVAFFRAPFDEALVRGMVRRAMPRIEALTLALPPPDGPRTTSGARKQRA